MPAADVLLTPKILATILEHLDPGPPPDDTGRQAAAPAAEPPNRDGPWVIAWSPYTPRPAPAPVRKSEHDDSDEREAGARRECKKALARLALVCRAVSEPALDALYQQVDDFTHLLCTIECYDRKTRMFRDTLTPTQWARFQTHAARVRALHLSAINDVHASVWIALTRLSPAAPLLPRLARLTALTLDALSPCYMMLFSPSLRDMEVKVPRAAEEGAVRVVLQAARPCLAGLRALRVEDCTSEMGGYGGGKRRECVPFWEGRELRGLDVVHAATLSVDILKSLASMQHLHTLSLNIKEMPNPVLLETVTITDSFPSLRDLTLKGPLGGISAFLAATRPPALDTLTIDVPELCARADGAAHHDPRLGAPDAQRDLAALYAALLPPHSNSKSNPQPTLKHFRATLACPSDASPGGGGWGGSCTVTHFYRRTALLSPLLSIPSLRTISIMCDNTGYHLADADLQELADTDADAKAWPELRVLEVKTRERPNTVWSGRVGHPAQPKRTDADHPTLRSICAFASAHPTLERLVLPSIDLDARPDVESVPLLGHPLRHFGVSRLDMRVPLYEFACALDRMFPELELGDAGGVVLGAAYGERARDVDVLRLLLLALQTGRRSASRGTADAPRSAANEDGEGKAKAEGMKLILEGRYLQAGAAKPGEPGEDWDSESVDVIPPRVVSSPSPSPSPVYGYRPAYPPLGPQLGGFVA
ncbi:hypothetical protein OH77DRAFT_1429056 [Trametes cingulata]|nr:hypothetical protein OH77DRAFT_1429056 [Trametes cingulata]